MSVNPEFQKLLNIPNVKFTIILGAGYHRQALGCDTALSSWDVLLKTLKPEAKLTRQYHLDFEKIIESEKNANEDSYKTEQGLIKGIQDIIEKEQTKPIDTFLKKNIESIKKIAKKEGVSINDIIKALKNNE